MTEHNHTSTATIDEVIIVLIEEDWGESHPHFHTHRHKFTILNKNNGETIHIRATDNATIQQVIDKMYRKLALQPKPEDRLHCKSGAEVFPFASLTVREYIEKGHCPNLYWIFAGGSGGA